MGAPATAVFVRLGLTELLPFLLPGVGIPTIMIFLHVAEDLVEEEGMEWLEASMSEEIRRAPEFDQ